MVDLPTESPLIFPTVTQVATSDLVIGGNNALAPNLQNKALKDRTDWIKAALDAFGLDPDSTAEEIRTAIGAAQGGSDSTDIASLATAQTKSRASIAEGRLTLATGDPEPSTDQTAATTVYYTAFRGSDIALWDGTNSRWDIFALPSDEISISIPATTDTNYDVFCYSASGTPTLELLAWSNSGAGTSARATAIVRADGIWTKTGDKTRRYLGTIRTTDVSGQCEDSKQKRFVWNVENQVVKQNLFRWESLGLASPPSTNLSWAYSTVAWRKARNTDDSRIETVLGLPTKVDAYSSITVNGFAASSIGINREDGNDATFSMDGANTAANHLAFGQYSGFLEGYNFLYQVENAVTGTPNFVAVAYINSVLAILTGIEMEFMG